jgi:hypothetical protein
MLSDADDLNVWTMQSASRRYQRAAVEKASYVTVRQANNANPEWRTNQGRHGDTQTQHEFKERGMTGSEHEYSHYAQVRCPHNRRTDPLSEFAPFADWTG